MKRALPDLLILDDDTGVGRLVADVAAEYGFAARVCISYRDFSRRMSVRMPRGIVLDLIMPDIDGIRIINELAVAGCRAGLVLTGGADPRVLDAALRVARERGLNVIGGLGKPLPPMQLRTLLRQMQMQRQPRAHAASVPAPRYRRAHDISERALLRALDAGEFGFLFQPQVACRTGRLCGFEALARWRHPEQGLVAPELFVPALEGFGLMPRFTGEVIDRSLAWLSRNFAAGAPDGGEALSLSVNISARNLMDPAFPDRLVAACASHGIATSRLVLELTETSAVEDQALSLELLARLRLLGFHVSIDDFGSGYSSLVQLARLPFSEIKVDRLFVAGAVQSHEFRAFIQSTVSLGQSLGLRTVAEGVEDEAVFRFLGDIGCDLAQGYWVGRPLAEGELDDWLARGGAQLRAVCGPGDGGEGYNPGGDG